MHCNLQLKHKIDYIFADRVTPISSCMVCLCKQQLQPIIVRKLNDRIINVSVRHICANTALFHPNDT